MGRWGGRDSPYSGERNKAKEQRYKLIAKARAGETTGQNEEQQQNMQEWARGIGYKGGFGLPPKREK